MAAGEQEMLEQQQQLNDPQNDQPQEENSSHVVELQAVEENTTNVTMEAGGKSEQEETKQDTQVQAAPTTVHTSNDGLIFELQSQLQSLQHRMEQMEKKTQQTTEIRAPETAKNDTDDENETPAMSRWECMIHGIGLIVFKFVTLLHFLHSFIGRCIIRHIMKRVKTNPSVLNKYKCCMQCCIIVNGFMYMLFPISMLYCLLWSPFALYDEIQSWMIAYCVWASFVCVYWLINAREIFQMGQSKILPKVNKALWILVGIALPEDKQEKKGYLSIMLASLLPAAVAGFVSNFVLEEKFILDCDKVNQLHDDQTVCTLQGQCCQIVSSHELTNIYQFGGTLVSNIIGTFAAIRILAWLMTKGDDELMAVAERKK